MSGGIVERGLPKVALDYASGAADRNGNVIDMAGYDRCTFYVITAAVATGAVTSVKVQQDTAPLMDSDPQDLAGSAVTINDDDDNQVKYITIINPRERYLRLVVDKDGTNVTAESAIAILEGGHAKRPVTPVAGSAEGEIHTSPAEGTA